MIACRQYAFTQDASELEGVIARRTILQRRLYNTTEYIKFALGADMALGFLLIRGSTYAMHGEIRSHIRDQ